MQGAGHIRSNWGPLKKRIWTPTARGLLHDEAAKTAVPLLLQLLLFMPLPQPLVFLLQLRQRMVLLLLLLIFLLPMLFLLL